MQTGMSKVAKKSMTTPAMAARIRKGVADGDVPEGTDCDMLAAYYSAVARGLAVQARDGASRSSRQERVAGREEWPIKLARRLMRLMSGMISRLALHHLGNSF